MKNFVACEKICEKIIVWENFFDCRKINSFDNFGNKY